MDTTIIFSHSETGHVLEYFHHIYCLCMGIQEKRFVFEVPERFKELSAIREWPDASNIVFDYISNTEVMSYKGNSVLRLSYNLSKVLNKRIRKYKANRVLSLFWFPIVPFGVFIFPRGLKVSAILYDVYLRELDALSLQAKMRHELNFRLFAKSRKVLKAFVLNDQQSTDILNTLYHSNHFHNLPDPYNPIKEFDIRDLRSELRIDKSTTVFAHFGGLTRRKGTLTILDAINLLSDDEKSSCFFIFAGLVYSDIKDEFYKKVQDLSCRANIFVKDEFCDDGYLASLCECCDAILMPYENANRSSGLLGYASQFCKPVIAPNNGLIGNIVQEYGLGITGEVSDTKVLAYMIRRIINGEFDPPKIDYCNINSIKNFCDAIKTTI